MDSTVENPSLNNDDYTFPPHILKMYFFFPQVVTSTLKDMREEEEKTLAQIVDRVEKHGMERARLAKELGEAAGEPDPSLGLVQLERLLRHEVGGLRARKEERMKEVLEFKRQDKAVCRQMAMEPFAISSTNIPSPEQFQALKKHLVSILMFFIKKS